MLNLILMGAILLATGYAVLRVMKAPSPGKALKRRVGAIRERHGENAGAAQAQMQVRKMMAATTGGAANSILPSMAKVRARLEQTGKDITPKKYLSICSGIFIFVFFVLLIKGAPFMLALFMGLIMGLGLPHFAIGFLIKKRLGKFNVYFPDAIELMVRGLRSGLPITETMSIVGSEIPDPVGNEFRAVGDAMRIGKTMEQALMEVAERLETPEFSFFCITLAIQRETGGNLAETLSNLADVLRKRAQMKLKIKAMSSESKASAMIVGALPFIVFTLVYLMNPGYIGKFFIDQRLMVAGLGGLTWMSIGVFIMAKMVNFEI